MRTRRNILHCTCRAINWRNIHFYEWMDSSPTANNASDVNAMRWIPNIVSTRRKYVVIIIKTNQLKRCAAQGIVDTRLEAVDIRWTNFRSTRRFYCIWCCGEWSTAVVYVFAICRAIHSFVHTRFIREKLTTRFAKKCVSCSFNLTAIELS